MLRFTWVLITGALLAFVCPLQAAEPDLAGNWKFAVFQDGQMHDFWLVKLDKKDNQWTAAIVAKAEGVPGAKVKDVKVNGDFVRLTVNFQNRDWSFEGKIPQEKGKKILGNISPGREVIPAHLEPTALESFDRFEILKDTIAKKGNEMEVMIAALELVRLAGENKAKPEEVRGWADKAFTTAELFGPRWQRKIAPPLADTLLEQDEYAAVALEYARKAQRLAEASEDFKDQLRALDMLASALEKNKKEDEARAIEKEADKIYAKHIPPFKPEKYEGRKKKSDRAVLVELFTGAQCPPCVAADIAFDAMEKTYQPTEVVLLQYHLHVPGPDPLTNADSEARSNYYDKEISGTPAVFFNGNPKEKAAGGGFLDHAKGKYEAYRKVIDPLLEEAAAVKLKVSAVRKGDKIDIRAEAEDLEKPGEKIRLRLALVEEQVRYAGRNQMRFHHHVVRALPGGADGVALKEKSGKHEATVDLGKLRDSLNKHLNEIGKEKKFPDAKRPMELKDFYVVAFVQDDETKEVLQAVQVKVANNE